MWRKPKGWCCEQLAQHFERRNERGAFVFAQPADPSHGREPLFRLSFLAVDPKHIQTVKEINRPQELEHISLQTWLVIRFCPWCGVQLDRHYKNQLDLMVDTVLLAQFPATLQ